MNSATPVLLALLLVISLVAVPVAAGPGERTHERPQLTLQEQAQTVTNGDAAEETSDRLPLENDDTRSEYIAYGSDFGTLLADADEELRIDYEQYVILDREFEEARDDEEREELVDNAYENIRDRASDLEEREKNAVKAHAAGELTTTALLQTLLRNYNEAATLQDALDSIEARANQVSGYSLSVQDDQDELETHRTPVRSYLDAAARGQSTDEATITVETSDEGFVLSYLDGSYVREATIFENRRSSYTASDFDDITDAFDRAAELYPWVFENAQSPSANEHSSVNLYLIQASHDQGRLEAYLDGWSEDVYREVQILRHTSLPTETETVWTGDGLNVTVNETPSNGPVEIVVTDAETDEPEPATVSVDGFEVGETDRSGSVWFAPPAGEYDVTVETEDSSFEMTMPND